MFAITMQVAVKSDTVGWPRDGSARKTPRV
jgi:hypothetical protein